MPFKRHSHIGRRLVAVLTFFVGITFAGIISVQSAAAQADPYQRSADMYQYRTAGQNGAARGEAIYYYKCWICHNQLTTTGGPHLKGLFGRQTLPISGQPVNDQTVRDKIRNGGPRMPKFEATLNDTDIADLISYLKDSKCCFEGDEPPPNPRFRAR